MMFLFLNNFIGFLYQINQIGLLQQMSQLFELSLLERSDFLWLFSVDLSLLRVDLIDESLHFVLKWFIFLNELWDFFVFIGMHDNDSFKLSFVHKRVLIDLLRFCFDGDLVEFFFDLSEFFVQELVFSLFIL